MFGRIDRSIVSALVFLLTAVTGAQASATTSVLLAFSSDRCGACQAMQPTLKSLEQSGVPIRHVDVNAEQEFARRHGIRQTPTFVVWSAGRELTRLVGVHSAQQLHDALAINPAGPLVQTGANVSNQAALDAPQTRLANTRTAAWSGAQGEAMPSVSLADAVQRAEAATVRLRVHDGHGFGVGTGTIIDRHGDEALVLTCGHLFRESKKESRVEVQLFVGGEVRSVPGQVVDYDADQRDIALVVIQPGFDVQPVKILPSAEPPQAGQSVFSFGCDHGDDPSRRDTRITGVNKYNQHLGASNIEIGGAPVDGRSGGGLFDSSGRLVGVCNAADYKGDVGIYTGPGSVQWQLDRVQLSHLYQDPASSPSPSQPLADAVPQTRLAALGTNTPMALQSPQNTAPVVNRSAQPAASTAGQPAAAGEMIVIVRDPSHPKGNRVLTVQRPTAELMEMIGRHAR
ncbi:trypsin-like peptidase domain-containing protein [Stieleria tagensis]|uniref:trypsin-like peptidase domain-containing protein n=1 Tax=Stieleria tagensis TaxID=2956795 RepID=UPI00209AF979|nr:trypsin-like peptidase domain-containing protein [Stieleria tagensis]